MEEVQSHVFTESFATALRREKQPRDCRYTALVEKGPGLSSRLSLSSANGRVTLQIQTWFQEPFKLIKLCGTEQIYEYKSPKAIPTLTHQTWAQQNQDEAHLLCPPSALPICGDLQECLQKNGKDNVVSASGQAWLGMRRGEENTTWSN